MSGLGDPKVKMMGSESGSCVVGVVTYCFAIVTEVLPPYAPNVISAWIGCKSCICSSAWGTFNYLFCNAMFLECSAQKVSYFTMNEYYEMTA